MRIKTFFGRIFIITINSSIIAAIFPSLNMKIISINLSFFFWAFWIESIDYAHRDHSVQQTFRLPWPLPNYALHHPSLWCIWSSIAKRCSLLRRNPLHPLCRWMMWVHRVVWFSKFFNLGQTHIARVSIPWPFHLHNESYVINILWSCSCFK